MATTATRTTARDEVLVAALALARRSMDRTFTAADVIRELKGRGTRFADATLRTHVISRMCDDAPDHHAVTYDDLERIGDGRYRPRR